MKFGKELKYNLFLVMQVVSHMMPDLPNVGLERDIEQFIVSKCPIFKFTFKIFNMIMPHFSSSRLAVIAYFLS